MNCRFVTVYHPRWGAVRGLESKRDIKRGEELFVHYGYDVDGDSLNPPWYYQAYQSEVGELPESAKSIVNNYSNVYS